MNAAEQFFQKVVSNGAASFLWSSFCCLLTMVPFQSVSITPAILTRVFEELRKASIDFVVAPFESDAQVN